ncbi:MAG TPA: hypothetical protein PKY82_31320 [Pyrinomonadaceae bacterium]|nr:hypothetical protein [Pyrinomonadaceae bacterium]
MKKKHLITFNNKTLITYPDAHHSPYSGWKTFQGETFLAHGIFSIPDGEIAPFTVVRMDFFYTGGYQFYSPYRFSTNQIAALRNQSQKQSADEIIEIKGAAVTDIKILEHYRELVWKEVRKKMTRVYVGRDHAQAKALGAIFYSLGGEWCFPPHIAADKYPQWLNPPAVTEPEEVPLVDLGNDLERSFLADPNLALKIVKIVFSNQTFRLAQITLVSKSFEIKTGLRAYHHFEFID